MITTRSALKHAVAVAGKRIGKCRAAEIPDIDYGVGSGTGTGVLWPRISKIDRYAALRMLVTGSVIAATANKRIVARATFENVAT